MMTERILSLLEETRGRHGMERHSGQCGPGYFASGTQIPTAGKPAGFITRPGAGGGMAKGKKGCVRWIILTASLWSVFGGQTTDFANPTRLHAASASPTGSAMATPRMPDKTSEGKAPDFTLASLEGSQVSLNGYKGKKGVVLVFFATWCVNCMKEVSEIKKFALAAQKENIEVLAINFKQRKDAVEKFQKANSINYRILLDTDGAVTLGKFGIRGLPHIIGIDMKGEMIFRGEDLPVNRTEFVQKLVQ